jgi:hypothetical protein
MVTVNKKLDKIISNQVKIMFGIEMVLNVLSKDSPEGEGEGSPEEIAEALKKLNGGPGLV